MKRCLAMTLLGLLLAAPFARSQTRTPAPGTADVRAPLPATTIADTVPPPPGAPNLAWLSSLEVNGGVPGAQPADSLKRAFMGSFRGAFAEGAYATERERGGHPVASLPVAAHFRLIEGTGGYGAWSIQVTVDELPRDGSGQLGLRVLVAALSPKAVAAGARPLPVETAFGLEAGSASQARDGKVATNARPTTWWRMAGRTTGLLVIERLHHLSGDLDEDTRLALGPAHRYESEARGAPAAKPRPGRP